MDRYVKFSAVRILWGSCFVDQRLDASFSQQTQASPVIRGRWTAQTVRVVLYAASLGLDTMSVIGAFLLTDWLEPTYWLPAPSLTILGTIVPLFVMFSISREAQSVESFRDFYLGLQRAVSALTATFFVEITLFFLTHLGGDISRLGFLGFFLVSCAFLLASHALVNIAVKLWLGSGIVATLVLLDGASVEAESGMTVINVGKDGLWPDLGKPDLVAKLSVMSQGFDRIVVACEEAHHFAWSVFLQGSDVGGEVVIGPDKALGGVGIGRCSNRDTLIMSRGPLSLANRVQKRVFDLVVASLLLILLAPLLIIVGIAIVSDSPGPILFKQRRIGKGNRYFEILKFRSMRVEATDSDGSQSAARNDARVSRVGQIIRRTSIDELPQLLNVIRGDMSLVGPRPHPLGSLAGSQLFWDVDQHYWQRHSLRPGITGLAQIRGYRGATDNVADLENRLRCDLEYLSNWNMLLDLRIMLATFRVLVHEKAY